MTANISTTLLTDKLQCVQRPCTEWDAKDFYLEMLLTFAFLSSSDSQQPPFKFQVTSTPQPISILEFTCLFRWAFKQEQVMVNGAGLSHAPLSSRYEPFLNHLRVWTVIKWITESTTRNHQIYQPRFHDYPAPRKSLST